MHSLFLIFSVDTFILYRNVTILSIKNSNFISFAMFIHLIFMPHCFGLSSNTIPEQC